ncbi:uncharacterized protein [Coffea arabica]|uniref:Tf2-1-like SH3-like domain-containing protein n=1 Tax=Coffea arabica TaxID=13443 RepID=A0ABM4WPQ0_COFAR
MGRGTGGVRTAGVPRGAFARGGRNGQGQVRETPSGGQAVTPQVSCGYCGKSNHVENDCWKKSGKCLDCEIRVGERKLLADWMSLAIKGYDVILVMDWLTRYHAQLNCKMKTVELCIPGEATLKLDVRGRLASSALISGIRVRKMLSKGAQAYLAFLINTPSDKVKLEDMPVVKEYPDVFSEKLESFSLEREIAFKIDVTSGVAPISKTPYRMAPAELKELKLQLQDLLERGERKILDPIVVLWIEEAREKVKLICQRIQIAQSRQKSYADNRRKDLEFWIGDQVFLKITPLKASLMAGKEKKLQSRFVGPYKILQRVGNVAYKLELPPSLSRIHNIFHVSILKKYHPDPSHVLQPENIEIDEALTYEERPVKLLDRKVKELRNKRIPLVKVLWKNHGVEEATWEVEEEIQKKYLDLFPDQGMNFVDEILLRR